MITGTAALGTDQLDEVSPEQQRQYLGTITRNAERLAAMAADLLDLARLEAGDLGIGSAATDLGEIIDQAVQTAAGAAAGKQLSVRLIRPSGLVCA